MRSFAKFELMVALEVNSTHSGRPLWLLTMCVSQVSLELWDIAGPRTTLANLAFLCLNVTNLILIAGDGLMTMSVWKNRYKPWVRQLVGPYVCTFSIACVVSVGTIVQKLMLVRERHQSRNAASHNSSLILGGVEVPIELA